MPSRKQSWGSRTLATTTLPVNTLVPRTSRKATTMRKVVLMKYNKMCPVCNLPYSTNRENKKHCSLTCRKVADIACYQDYRESSGMQAKNDFSTGTTGAIHELVVCVELMKKGFHVFRALSPSCPCDVLCMTNTKTLRIEITTGTRGKLGGESFPKKSDRYLYDYLAVVFHDGSISWYNRANEKCIMPQNDT